MDTSLEFNRKYLIGTNGLVYRQTKKGLKALKGTVRTNGYLTVTIATNGKRKDFFIHRLVAENFLENPDSLPVVNHKDGNKTNNNVSNLEWCTYKRNTQHALETGLMKTGEEHPRAKLTEAQVKAIKEAIEKGVPCLKLAKIYNVASSTIDRIKRGKIWKHIQ
jgi:hypothetical protein